MRGYFADMGMPGVNDFDIYDDAMIVVGPGCWATFNAKTDPPVRRKHVAVPRPGIWQYRPA